MATPLDVVTQHRRSAWFFFVLIIAGFLALCAGTTVWRAHQRNNPPVAQQYLKDPVTLGDVSFCLTNGWGFFPMNISGIYASCEVGVIYSVPWAQAQNTSKPLASKPAALADQDMFKPGVSTFQADESGCSIVQSFRTGVLGDVPRSCFKFQVAPVPYAQNTSVTMTLAFQANAYTNATSRTGPIYNNLPGPQAAAVMFADGLNSDGNFELTFQGMNSSNLIVLSPSIRKNIKTFPNGNYTWTTVNPSIVPFVYNYLPGSPFNSSANNFIQIIVTTSPRGYQMVTEQDPLNALSLLPAYGGFWPYFVFAFGLFFTAESSLYIRPFLIAWTQTCVGRVKQHKAKRTQSGVPVLAGEEGSGPVGGAPNMTDAAKRDRPYMSEQADPKLADYC